MQLTEEQAVKLRRHLKSSRPCPTVSDQRESRRFEDETVSGDADARGYGSVVVYIQRGLGNANGIVSQVLRHVASVQNDNNLEYPVFLFSFGWDDGTLHHAVKCRNGGPGINSLGWAQALCDMATADSSPKPAVIPALFPPAKPISGKRKVGHDDLLVFFCRDRSVCLSEAARAQYSKHPAKQSVWIYCTDGNPDMSLGAREANMCDNQTLKETTMTVLPSKKLADPISRNLSKNDLARMKADFAFLLKIVSASKGELAIALRGKYFNIYYRGNSLAKVAFRADGSYLVELSDKFYCGSKAALDGRFTNMAKTKNGRVSIILQTGLLHPFFQKEHLLDFCQLIKKRNYCEETTFEQMFIADNACSDWFIIDRQVADAHFSGQMDLLGLRQLEPGCTLYGFEILEVKLGNNPELTGKVAQQLQSYVDHLTKQFDSYKACYEKVYLQLKALELLPTPAFDSIEITGQVKARIIVVGYSGIGASAIQELIKASPSILVHQLTLRLKTDI